MSNYLFIENTIQHFIHVCLIKWISSIPWSEGEGVTGTPVTTVFTQPLEWGVKQSKMSDKYRKNAQKISRNM